MSMEKPDIKNKSTVKSTLLNILISLGVNLAVLASALHFSVIVYETNDDFAISEKLAAGYPFIGFVNYYLCKFLILIQKSYADINIFVLSQIVVSFIALTAILWVLLERRSCIADALLAVMAVAVFSLDHYCAVQFTKTAALLMTAGLLLVADSYIHDRKIWEFIAGFILFYLGVMYRQKGMLPAMAFAGCFVIVWLLIERKEFFKDRKLGREAVLVLLLAVIAVIPFGLDKLSDNMNESTPELKLGREYQAERVKVTDYPLLEYYEASRDKYAEIGLDENDLTVINRWMFDYDGAASLENLKAINEINAPLAEADKSIEKSIRKTLRVSWSMVMDLDFNGMHIIMVGILILYILFAKKPKALFYALVMAVLAICMYAAVFYMQRPQYRALYVGDINAVFWLLYAAAVSQNREAKAMEILRNIVACAGAAAMVFAYVHGLERIDDWKEHNAALIEPQVVTDYFAANTDLFFIGPTTVMQQPASYLTPMVPPHPAPNVSGTGGWETMTPYKIDFLANYGIENPIKDLIDNEGVRFYGAYKKDMLNQYLNKWYCDEGEEIVFEKTDEVNDTYIYKVVKVKYW